MKHFGTRSRGGPGGGGEISLALSAASRGSFLAAMLFAALPAAAQQPQWRPGPPMPTARSEVHAALLDNCLYVAGGLSANFTTAAFECLDLATQGWRRLAPLPSGVHHAPVAALGGRVWLSGGYTTLGFSFNDPVLWSYDPAANTWSVATKMPGRRAAHVFAALGGRLYVVGGTGDAAQEVWSYDPAANQWRTNHAKLPRTLEHAGAAVHGGKLWIFGGRWRGDGEFRSVFAYDPAREAWERAPDMPDSRGGHTAAVLGDKAYILGGERLGSGTVETQMLVFDFTKRTWTTAPRAASPTVGRHGVASIAAANCIWLIGGGTAAGWRTFFTASAVAERLCP
jgi:N-acetylneuraminic acid mutarotase